MRLCDRTGCDKPAKWMPVLRLYPPHHIGNQHADTMLDLGICDECKGKLVLDDVLSDDGWSQIVMVFVTNGRYRPQRSRTELLFITIEQAGKTWEKFPKPS